METLHILHAGVVKRQVKETIERIINDGCNGLLCIIL